MERHFENHTKARKDAPGLLQNQPEDSFWIESITGASRTETWLSNTSSDLFEAARSWDPPFNVSRDDIEKHIQQPDEVLILRNTRQVVGFIASTVALMARTGLTARYIAGTIMHRWLGGKRKFERMMRHFPKRADLEILHTQSPFMVEALASRSQAVFPTLATGQMMSGHLLADLRELLQREGRNVDFCPATGIAIGFYGRCLYETWPIPDADYSSSSCRFLLDNDTSAVVVIGFADADATHRYLVPSTTREIR